jgi:hypothetical protein
LLRDALPPVVASVLTPVEVETMRQRVAGMPEPSGLVPLNRADYHGATAVFLLVFLSTFPIVIPFLVIQNVAIALRASNAVAIVMMFATGWSPGRYPDDRAGAQGWPWSRSGSCSSASLSRSVDDEMSGPVHSPWTTRAAACSAVAFIAGASTAVAAAPGEEHGLSQRAVEIARPFGFPITNSMLVTWIVAVGLIVFAQLATRRMQQVPDGAQNFLEGLVEGRYRFLEGIIGVH